MKGNENEGEIKIKNRKCNKFEKSRKKKRNWMKTKMKIREKSVC